MPHLAHTIIYFAIVLGIMVLIHELGHFAVAKWCGVRVETFSIGFGPRLFGFRHGDTDYRISLLPLGGYVKMAGDVPGEAPSGDPGEFNAHPRSHRIMIALAGPIANFILSFFLLMFLAMFHHEVDEYLDRQVVADYVPAGSPAAQAGLRPGDPIVSFNNKANPDWNTVFNECALNEGRTVSFAFRHDGGVTSGVVPCKIDKDALSPAGVLVGTGILPWMQPSGIEVNEVTGGTPADRAGLKPGDKILRVDNFEPHSVEPALVTYLQDRKGAPSTLTVLRGTQTISMNVTPELMPATSGGSKYRIGFSHKPAPTKVVRLGLFASMGQSVKDNLADSTLILRVLKGLFTRHVSVKNLSGPVGIAQQIDIAARTSWWALIRTMSSISLNLGIFNLLPIPILDGGMILFLLIESMMRRDLSVNIKERVYQVAFVCLILFAAFVFYNDLTRH